MRLEGKVAIITGAGSGMGAATARLFASEGATVVVADTFEEGGNATVAQITEAGGRAQFVATDVTDESAWERLIATTDEAFGKLDILVNNAGISGSAFDDPTSTEGWRTIMGINADGVFLGTKHAIPIMTRGGGGSIVNMSSIMGFIGTEGAHPAYSASKGAVRLFTKATAVQQGPNGIRANSVHPGFMPPMRSSTPVADRRQRAADDTPLRRTGEAIEVAYGILFLASDEASFVTGTELVIDGGYLAQ